MAPVRDKVCLNHPHSAAVSRCLKCFKPLCSECVVIKNDQDFCSEECAQNHAETNRSIKEFGEKERKTKLAKLIKKLMLLTVLMLVGFLAYRYWIDHKEKVKETADELKNKTKQLRHNFGEKLN